MNFRVLWLALQMGHETDQRDTKCTHFHLIFSAQKPLIMNKGKRITQGLWRQAAVVMSYVPTRSMSVALLPNSQCTKRAYLHCKVFLVYQWVYARQLVSIFKAFQINVKAGAFSVGREGLATSGSSECHLLITSFLPSGLSPRVGFSCLCFLAE